MTLAPTDVVDVVQTVVATAGDHANGHRFVAEVDGRPGRANADPDKLRQVLDQLVANAVKYSPGGGTVTVSVERRADAIEIAVADEGVGIPAADRRPNLLQVHEGRRAGPARGWGCSSRAGLVREMGGRMWVESTEGVGARFVFALAPPRMCEIPGMRGITEPMPSGTTRVLVIDDEAPIRLLCRVNLEAEGMQVLEAADGPSGLEKARAETPDVVLLDVMMPGLDGWRVAEELLDDPAHRSDPDRVPHRARGAPRPRARHRPRRHRLRDEAVQPGRARTARARSARACRARRAGRRCATRSWRSCARCSSAT